MAEFVVNAQRFDPYKNFKFRVKWDGRYVAGVSKVGALKRTTEVVKHREGGDPSSSRKSPGRTEFEAITLERGVTHDTEFEKWANKVWNFGSGLGAEVSLKDFRKDIIIDVYNEAGSSRSAIRFFAPGSRNFRHSPISKPTPTRSPSSTSSSRTKAGNATTTSKNQVNQPLLSQHEPSAFGHGATDATFLARENPLCMGSRPTAA
jgi:phage tail-like protein